MPYDALKAPDPQAWLDLDEQERIDQVIEHHRRHHLPMGESVKLHGVAHVVVENQVALGDPPAVREALARLMSYRTKNRTRTMSPPDADTSDSVREMDASSVREEDANSRYVRQPVWILGF